MEMQRDQKFHYDLLNKMILLRTVEQKIAKNYKDQEMRTPTHLGVGQEAVAAGICSLLNEEDVIFSHHRCHNHYLAKGGNVKALINELYGREDGCSRGRGGSVHLTDRAKGVVATSAILGQMASVATGAALAIKMDNLSNIAVSFFGDGAFDEGSIYESFNYASINKLPVLFVCENNLYSTETHLNLRKLAGTEFLARAEALGIPGIKSDGNDILSVLEAAEEAIIHCRSGRGPFILEFITYRWLEHVGPYFDHEQGRSYRSKNELDAQMHNCPLKKYKSYLLENNLLSSDEISAIELDIENSIEEIIQNAKKSRWPEVNSIMDYV